MNTYPVCAIIPPLGQASSTWANFPAASSVPVGTYRTATDYNHTEWYSDGTYWKPRGGRQRIYNTLVAFSTTGGTSEVAAWTPGIPASMLFPGCKIYSEILGRKTGASATATPRIRYNGAGGTAICGATSLIAASNVGYSMVFAAAAGQISGGNITITQTVMGSLASNAGAVTTAIASVTHTVANAVTLNYTLQPGNAGDTLYMDHGFVEICG